MAKEYRTPKENRITRPSVFAIVFCVLLSLYTISIIIPLLISVNLSLSSDEMTRYLGTLNPFWNHIGSRGDKAIDFWDMTGLTGKEEFYFGSIFQNYKNIVTNLVITKDGTYRVNGKLYGRSDVVSKFPMLVVNTFGYSLGGALANIIALTLMSYACAKYKNPVSKFLFALNIFMMSVPILGGTSSTVELSRSLHIYDTYFGYLIFKFTWSGIYFLTLSAFFMDLPDAYNEAAEIDGASQFYVMITICIPLAVKILITITLLTFVGLYNDYRMALLYMPTHPTLAYAVYELSTKSSGGNTTIPARMAGIMTLAFPMFVLFMIFRNRMMGNVSVGGIKG